MVLSTTTGTVLGALGFVLSVLAAVAVLLITLRVIPSAAGPNPPASDGQRTTTETVATPSILWSNMPSGTSIKLGYNQPSAAANAVPYSLVLDAQCANGYETCEMQPIANATQIRPLRKKTAAESDSVAVYWSPSTYELSADYATGS